MNEHHNTWRQILVCFLAVYARQGCREKVTFLTPSCLVIWCRTGFELMTLFFMADHQCWVLYHRCSEQSTFVLFSEADRQNGESVRAADGATQHRRQLGRRVRHFVVRAVAECRAENRWAVRPYPGLCGLPLKVTHSIFKMVELPDSIIAYQVNLIFLICYKCCFYNYYFNKKIIINYL